ncbi:MAG: CBS domain-containing protein [Candidatus Thermoplasmatota archaeon]|nr:CBS domain-containing protein [Candidatus Thermoplasmatota archaeon]
MLKVREVMTKTVTTVTPDTLVKDAAAILALRNISGVPVVDGDKIVGIFSEADVLKSIKTTKKDMRLIYPSISSLGIAFQEEVTQREIIGAYEEIGRKPVKDIMSTRVVTVAPDIPINEVIVKMVQMSINRLPVVDKNVIVGIVTRGDVIRGLAVEHAVGEVEGNKS